MTNGDWIRSMSDIELATFFETLLSEREAIISERLTAQGIPNSIVSMPGVSVLNHLKFLRSPFESEPEE